MTAARVAARARRLLRAAGNAAVARGARAFFKQHEKVRCFGVATPRLRAIESALYAEVGRAWSTADAVACCEALVRTPELEAKALGLELLGRFQRAYDRTVLARAKGWLARGWCANWATVDTLAPRVITPALRRFPDRIPALVSWARSRNLWIRRAAAVSLVPLARRGEHLDAAYAVAALLLGDHGDLIHKATGWLLREAGKTDPARLEAFLLRNGRRVPRTTLRYAIERFAAGERKRLMEATRG